MVCGWVGVTHCEGVGVVHAFFGGSVKREGCVCEKGRDMGTYTSSGRRQ